MHILGLLFLVLVLNAVFGPLRDAVGVWLFDRRTR